MKLLDIVLHKLINIVGADKLSIDSSALQHGFGEAFRHRWSHRRRSRLSQVRSFLYQSFCRIWIKFSYRSLFSMHYVMDLHRPCSLQLLHPQQNDLLIFEGVRADVIHFTTSPQHTHTSPHLFSNLIRKKWREAISNKEKGAEKSAIIMAVLLLYCSTR